MILSELFRTLQGEGTYIGVPSIFIRTSTCNLACHFCDTPYTSWWNDGKKQTVDHIIDLMYSTYEYTKHIVITGGEPMIQKDIGELTQKLMDNGHVVTIETNGTVFKEDVRPSLFSVSPKIDNSIPDENNYPSNATYTDNIRRKHIKNNNLETLHGFVNSSINYQMKFVICDDNDLPEIRTIIDTYKIPKENVFLMPEGFTREKQRARSLKIAEICKNEGYTFCPRLHVELWGTKRGV